MNAPETYTVGWVCAIHPEYVAAQEFLDEEYGTPAVVAPHDDNTYMLGKVGEHKVVIASLPCGEYGIASASRVAANMLSSFPNVRIGLLVGIGGGAPSAMNDIRLGDVVISVPSDGESGVFQYDFGKTIQGQPFQHTRILNQPPTLLRSAVSSVMAKHQRHGNQIEQAIEAVFDKNRRLRRQYHRPGNDTDRLFKSDIVYDPSRTIQPSDLVHRRERTKEEDNPAIHYGLIASANQVMKDALIRDRYARERNVLCFEMEAAGLMNDFPCLVIRGICDYSDSHKSKEWQGYAAMAASAYAKDILKAISPSKVDEERKLKEVVELIQQSVDQVQTGLDSMRDEAIMHWLGGSSHSVRHGELCHTKHEDTGRWFLDSNEFRTWLDTKGKTIFCWGVPGVGKSTMTAITVSHLTSMNPATKFGIAYLYLDYLRQGEQGIENLMAAALRQLACTNGSVDECVQSLYLKREKSPRPSRGELEETLKLLIGKFDRTFLVVDALDEGASKCRKDLVSMLLMLQHRFEVNIFVTSRDDPKIFGLFDGHNKMIYKEIVGSPEDLRSYLDFELLSVPQGTLVEHQGLFYEAKRIILQVAEGVFLIAHLCLHFLHDRAVSCPQEYRSALRELQESVSSKTPGGLLHDIYEKTVNQIGRRKDKLADRVLLCLVSCREPMRLIDLQVALGISASGMRPGGTDSIHLGAQTPERILSACLGLLTIEPVTGYVRFSHQTAHEYFKSIREQKFQGADGYMAKICMACLSTSPLPPSITYQPEEQVEWGNSPPFYMYAARHWGHHAREATDCFDETVEFLGQRRRVDLAGHALMSSIDIPDRDLWADNPEVYCANRRVVGPINAFHLVAFFGLEKAFRSLLAIGQSQKPTLLLRHRFRKRVSSEATWYSFTPLHFAVLGGQEGLTKLLLDYGAAVNAEDFYRRTPYALATHMRRQEIECMLKKSRGKTMVRNRKEWLTTLANLYLESFPRMMSL
ncbi:hypothetical protein F5144DRAFT_579014 [Chaetomium tenue]|uniref:Uncharacterized protein n=1 Tax=Chaetomium tenue TaxID=1854479 RepID=A0ACB7P696_9PEZI|nr:hypothetical protein F5144DRAFT_579014 [Chaetomium globosum]